MRRLFGALVSVGCFFSSSFVGAFTIDGGVYVAISYQTGIRSVADTTVYTGVQIDWGPYIYMEHNVFNANDTDIVYGSGSPWGHGQIVATLIVPRLPSTCYNAENISTIKSQAWPHWVIGWDSWLADSIACTNAICGNSPILLDLARNGFHLSGAAPPVQFDIDADGSLDAISWTSAQSDDVFLCLDRNLNGQIDDGTELFGSVAPLASGDPAGNGYRALAELDTAPMGGNGDGFIDRRDQAYSSLCVWNDLDRDGVTDVAEARLLSVTAVRKLEFDYEQQDLYDAHGNLFWLRSTAWMQSPGAGLRPWPTYDVIFLGAQESGQVIESCDPLP